VNRIREISLKALQSCENCINMKGDDGAEISAGNGDYHTKVIKGKKVPLFKIIIRFLLINSSLITQYFFKYGQITHVEFFNMTILGADDHSVV